MSKAETKFDVAGVVRKHRMNWQHNHCGMPGDCGWTHVYRDDQLALAAHEHHVAAAISAHIAETLGSSETREAAWRAILEVNDAAFLLGGQPNPRATADAALAAVGDLLGVEVGR